MQITFNPHDPKDVAVIENLLQATYMTGGPDGAALAACAGRNCGSTNPAQHSEECHADHEATVSGVDSAKIFAGNATVPATSAQSAEPGPAAEQTGAASADPAQQAGQNALAHGQAMGNHVASVASAPAPQAGQSNLSFDSAGIPWDARIHAETKAQKKDGTWRTKRGVDKDYVKQITDELRAQHSDVSQATIPPVPGQAQQEATAPPPPTVSAPTNTAPPPPTTVVPTTASAGQITTFPDFMKAVTQYMAANGITMIDINNMLSSTMGIQSAAMLSNKPELIPQALANIGIQ